MKITDWIMAIASCAMVFIGSVQLEHNMTLANYALANENYQIKLSRMEKELNEAKNLNLHSLNQWEKQSALLFQTFKTRKDQCLLMMVEGSTMKECLDSAYKLFDIWEQSERERIERGENMNVDPARAKD